jgi:hypothetical protein
VFAQDNLCGPCTLGLQRVKDTIERPDATLLGELNKGCEQLPPTYQSYCKMAVQFAGVQILTFLRDKLKESPKELCTKWKLCGSNYKVEPAQGYLCQACLLGVSLIKDYANQPDE